MSKILVTGGAGFIGCHLACMLVDRGKRVDLIDNFARGARDAVFDKLTSRPRVTLIERDLSQPGAIDDLDTDYGAIYHLASTLGVAKVRERPYQVLRENFIMVDNALELARRQSRLKRFVFASTSEVYAGSQIHGDPIYPTPEATPLVLTDIAEPRTSYMLSKVYGEAMCHHAGVPFTIVRPHNVYGPRMGMAHVVPELLERARFLRGGEALEVFSVDHRRTFCFVDDAVEMMIRLAEDPAAEGGTFNVGNERPEVTMGQLAGVVLEVVGRRAKIRPRPPTPGSPPRRCPDMSHTAAVTGYRSKVPLHEGIARSYAWYEENVFSPKRTRTEDSGSVSNRAEVRASRSSGD